MDKKEILAKIKPKPSRRQPDSHRKLPHQFGSVTRYNDGNRTKPFIVRGPFDPALGRQPYLTSVRTEEEAYEILVKRRNNPYLFAKTTTTFADAYELESLMPDAAVIQYDGCTHYAYLERLGQTNRIIKNFIKEK